MTEQMTLQEFIEMYDMEFHLPNLICYTIVDEGSDRWPDDGSFWVIMTPEELTKFGIKIEKSKNRQKVFAKYGGYDWIEITDWNETELIIQFCPETTDDGFRYYSNEIIYKRRGE